MKLKEFKELINNLPEDMNECEVLFGETAYGEKVKRIQKLGKRVYLSFV